VKLINIEPIPRRADGTVDEPWPQPIAGCPIKPDRLGLVKSANGESNDIKYAVWHKLNGRPLRYKYRTGI